MASLGTIVGLGAREYGMSSFETPNLVRGWEVWELPLSLTDDSHDCVL